MRKLLILAATMLLAQPASAKPWDVDPLTSSLRFEAEQAGETFTGSFPKFSSTITFDEAAPEKGSMHIAITMAAVQVEGKDRLDALPTKDWFAAKEFPFAEYTATGFKKTGEHQYLALGRLQIRGVVKPLDLPFTLKTTGNAVLAKGEVTLNRSDFGIGQGQWKSDEWVKYPVRVIYEIRATARR